MLSHNTIVATIAVKDMAKAQKFYEKTLGLKKKSEIQDVVTTYESGDCHVFVYKSDYAGHSKATVATWIIDHDIDGVVRELQERGVTFEHYPDMPGIKVQGDMHVGDGMKAAWFKDPDGNILALVHEED